MPQTLTYLFKHYNNTICRLYEEVNNLSNSPISNVIGFAFATDCVTHIGTSIFHKV